MNTSLDCIPCIFRQALDASRRVSDAPDFHEQVIREVAGWVSSADLEASPPVLAQRLHRYLRERTEVTDPYAAAKQCDNALALSLLPELRERISRSSEPFTSAVRFAIAGNVIDLGPKSNLSAEDIVRTVRQAEETPFSGDIEAFRSKVQRAPTILYLADNAGEIVLDRLLIEALGPERVTVAVRGTSVINDATLEDARTAELTGWVTVISNGSDAPGTVLTECNTEFRNRFEQSDLVISKGQGNFETLNNAPREIHFLFIVKCPVVAAQIGLPIGTLAVVVSNDATQRRGDE